MKKVNKTKNSTFNSSSAWCLSRGLSSQLLKDQGLALNKPLNVESLKANSLTTREPGALHRANLIKINKINNILLSDNSFNAKMDSVHYDSNKLIIENSKFLKKHEKIKNNKNSAPTCAPAPAQQSIISLKDTSLSLMTYLSKGIGTISEIIKPNKSISNLNQGYTSNQINLSNKSSLSNGEVSRSPFPQLKFLKERGLDISIENKTAGAVPSESRDLATEKENQIKGKSVLKGQSGNNLNIFDFISSYLSRPEGKSVAITMAKAQAARAAIKMEMEGSVDGTQVIDVACAADNKTKDTILKINKKVPLVKSKGNLDLTLLNQHSPATKENKGESLARVAKVDPASLNKIKSSSTITQKVYDYISDNKDLSRSSNINQVSTGSASINGKVINNSLGFGIGAKLGSALPYYRLFFLPNFFSIPKAEEKKNKKKKLEASAEKLKKTIIHKYLSNITKSNSHININPNLSKKFGILFNYNRSLGYTFLNKIYCLSKDSKVNLNLNQDKLSPSTSPLYRKEWRQAPFEGRAISEYISLEDIYKLLYYFFKSIYCIISKPTILFSPDKITIRLFYYLVIPKKKVLKLFTIYNFKEKREEWMQKKLNYNIIRKIKQKALLSPDTRLKKGTGSKYLSESYGSVSLKASERETNDNLKKNWNSSLSLLSPLLNPGKSMIKDASVTSPSYSRVAQASPSKGGALPPLLTSLPPLDKKEGLSLGTPLLELRKGLSSGERGLELPNGISTADSNNSALRPISTENKSLSLDKSSANYIFYNKRNNYNIKKIRLPFMKYKVKKVISRLKSKSPIIRDLYINLREFNIVKVFHNKFLLLTKILSTLFKKPVVLEITRIHNFKYDSNILANLIQFVVKNKRKKPRIAINKIYRKKNIKLLNDPNLASSDARYARNKVITFLSGLNIYINGRLMREPIIPRISTKKFEKGASARGKVNYIDTSYITKKNRKGAYTIKVKSAQNFL